MEADRLTGPAKNLLRFGTEARPGVELSVATYLRGGAVSNGFLDAARSVGLAAYALPEAGRFDRKVIGDLVALIERVRPDVVQTHNTKSHLLMRLSGIWRRTPWIAFHHGHTAEDLKMRLYNQCDRWSLRRPRQLVTVCGPFADQLHGYGISRERIEVVPNAVEPPRELGDGELAEWRARLNLRPGEPVLAVIGRLSSEKGHPILIEALASLRDRPWRLLVAGDGISRSALETQARAAGLEGRVEWLGMLKDVRPVYGLASLFILPSLSEGSPNVLLEAMAAGVPAVSTAVGGVPDTVTHEETALLVPAGDAMALGKAVERLLTDPALADRLAAAARERARSFSLPVYLDRLRAIYQRVLSAPADG
jgi:glycosyltransferase involved in cell wall biosynthesis